MLTIKDLSFYLGNKQLYDNCNLTVVKESKIGLVGPNGAGKSTLLRLINGDLQPDSGEIIFQNGFTCGFLNQDHLSYKTQDSIKTVAMQAFTKIATLEKKLEEIHAKMLENYSDKLCEEMEKITEEIISLGGDKMESEAEAMLESMDFETSDLNRPMGEFSGGWRMRVMLAKIQLQHPSLMLLDEPTNHLDIEAIKWLEDFLIKYDKAFIVISHDRYFLNKISNTIIELDNKTLTSYKGNYDHYEEAKTKNLATQQKMYEQQQKDIEKMTTFINRFGAKATKAKQAKSMEKKIEKMEKVERVRNTIPQINFSFDIDHPSGRRVVTLENISKSYGDIEILKNSSGIIDRENKIALIGENGKGKSTLLRMIFNNNNKDKDNYEPIDSGKIEFGPNVTMAFYTQDQLESLNKENTIIQELTQIKNNTDEEDRTIKNSRAEEDIRKVCGMFLFKKDDVYKKIGILSGGERARVALIKILLQGANFILLDEPTNHLDIISKEILAQAINDYNGTCIVVSHDRYFVNKIANKIWYIEDRVLKEYLGTYDEYIKDQNKKKDNI